MSSLVAGILLAATVRARAEDLSVRPAITVEQVSSALSGRGLVARPDQIEMLSLVNARVPRPTLRVTNIDRLNDNESRIRLVCRSTSICLPFYVLLRSRNVSAPETPASPPLVRAKQPEIVIHGGEHATMVFEGRDMRITFPVISLQNGALGQRIRVMSTDRKRTYSAQVIRPGFVTTQLD